MKIRILLADDEQYWRDIFKKTLYETFPDKYEFEITECVFAVNAIDLIVNSKREGYFFDIIVADINFSENEVHEEATAGFKIIERGKKIHPKAKTIWFTAQHDTIYESGGFDTEIQLNRNGLIDYHIRKKDFIKSFNNQMPKCLKQIENEKTGLLIPLAQLFGTYNYAPDENDGFYKIIHMNFSWEEMKNLIPRIKNILEEMRISSLLKTESYDSIEKYLSLIENRKPFENELYTFKSKFRFEFSEEIFNKFQAPLLSKGVKCSNNYSFKHSFTIFAESDRLFQAFATIYENIAQHNFLNHTADSSVSTTITLSENELLVVILSNGDGFDPENTFNSHPIGGLRKIFDNMNYYCSLVYESNRIMYDVFHNVKTESPITEGVKITLGFNLPKVIKRDMGDIYEA
jgi:hypothetical protein